MSTDSYPILVNTNPVPVKQKPKITFKKFLVLIIVLILLTGSWYLIQNKPWQKGAILEDPTTLQILAQTHPQIWMAFFEIDTRTKQVRLQKESILSGADIFTSIISEKPQPKEGEWAFGVQLENEKGKITYRTYRTMTIFPKKENPMVWEFGIAMPYEKDGILRIIDLEDNQIFARKI